MDRNVVVCCCETTPSAIPWSGAALATHLTSSGARLFERSPALAVSGDAVETDHGKVRCRAVIVAVDGGLASLLPELSDEVGSARLQMLGTAPDRDRTFAFATGTRWGWDYWQQTPSGAVALGGCRDVAEPAEWTEDPLPSAVVQGALDRRLREGLGVTASVTHRWAAAVSYTGNGLPVIAEARPRVWALGGYCGTGNLVGAVAGRAVAHIALGRQRETPFD